MSANYATLSELKDYASYVMGPDGQLVLATSDPALAAENAYLADRAASLCINCNQNPRVASWRHLSLSGYCYKCAGNCD